MQSPFSFNDLNVTNKKFWLSAAFVVKVIFFVFFLFHFNKHFGNAYGKNHMLYKFVLYGADSYGYIEPTESFFDGNGYKMDGQYTAFRMPGFVTTYGPLYWLFGRKVAMILFIIFQFVLSVISVYVLSITSYKIFKQKAVFVFTFILYAASTFVSIYDHALFSESVTTSLLIFALYFFTKYYETQELKYIFISGSLFAWANLFRPAIIVVIGIVCCFLLLRFLKQRILFSTMARSMALFLTPVFGFLSIWITRNFLVLHSFIPFIHQEISSSEMAILKFTKAMGANWYEHNGNNTGFQYWFIPSFSSFDGLSDQFNAELVKSNPFDKTQFTPDYNFDSLKLLRDYNWKFLDRSNDIDLITRGKYNKRATGMAQRFTSSYVKHRFINFIVWNKLKVARDFLFIRESHALPVIGPSIFDKAVRVFYVLFYYGVIVTSLLVSLYFVISRLGSMEGLLSIILLGLILFHVMIAFTENRYLVPVYPICVIFTAFFTNEIFKKLHITQQKVER